MTENVDSCSHRFVRAGVPNSDGICPAICTWCGEELDSPKFKITAVESTEKPGLEVKKWCVHVGGLGPPFPFCETCQKEADIMTDDCLPESSGLFTEIKELRAENAQLKAELETTREERDRKGWMRESAQLVGASSEITRLREAATHAVDALNDWLSQSEEEMSHHPEWKALGAARERLMAALWKKYSEG
jgi:hypothetical protein